MEQQQIKTQQLQQPQEQTQPTPAQEVPSSEPLDGRPGSSNDGLSQEVTEGNVHGQKGEEEEEVTQRIPTVPKAPFMVTKEEREAHEVTHTPFRSWCPYCVRSRARNSPHKSREETSKREGVPKIALDYFFMSLSLIHI